MKKNQVIDLGLTGYDELFMNDQERADIRKPKVEEIPLTELTSFKDHPFKVKNDEEMAELMKSIADSGVLAPALARSKARGGYELISGHRRLAACKALGMETMPVIIRNLTDEEAVITMVDSNLQREHMNPKTLQYLMGHSDIGVTMNIYTHLGLEDAKEEIIRMEELNAVRAELNKTTGEKPVTQKMFKVV